MRIYRISTTENIKYELLKSTIYSSKTLDDILTSDWKGKQMTEGKLILMKNILQQSLLDNTKYTFDEGTGNIISTIKLMSDTFSIDVELRYAFSCEDGELVPSLMSMYDNGNPTENVPFNESFKGVTGRIDLDYKKVDINELLQLINLQLIELLEIKLKTLK